MSSTHNQDPAGPTQSAPVIRKAALAFILVTVVLDMLALGIIVPVLPKLILQFKGGDSAGAAAIYGIFGTVYAVISFFSAPILGAMSDTFGRRPAILLSNFGLGFDYILVAWAPSLGWLLAGRIIAGICSSGWAIPGAYIADVTPPEKRAASFGMLGAAFGLGFVIGPAFGGLLGSISPRLPFWVAAGLSLTNALYGLFILPESLPKERRAPFLWSRANPIGSFILLKKYPGLLGIAAVTFLSFLAHEVMPSMWVLYTDFRYHWTTRMVGTTLAAVGICSVVVQGGLIRVTVKKLGERRALLLGLACGMIGFAVSAMAPTGILFCVSIPFIALWGFAGAAVQALMSQRTDPTEQGRLQGAIAGLRGFAGMLGPVLFTWVFAKSIALKSFGPLPGAPFLLATGLLFASFSTAIVVAKSKAKA